MNGQLRAQIVDVCITDYCSLNCKLCILGMPYITNKHHIAVEEYDRQLSEIFKIWNSAERLNLIGGEALLHPNICDIVERSLHYQDHYQSLRITTNDTIVPEDRMLALMASSGKPCNFVISDYGKLSRNLQGLTERLESYNIPYRIDPYVGDNLYYGGWVDLGDYEFADLSKEELMVQYRECAQTHTHFLSVYKGEVFQCCHAHHFNAVKGALPEKTEYIDLCDEELTIEEKKEIASRFFTMPTKSCQFCLGFNEKTSKRYPAAEQL